MNIVKKVLSKLRRVWKYVGRRGVVLGSYSLLFFSYAYSILVVGTNAPALAMITKIAPSEVWGGIWGFAGIFCFLGSWRHEFHDVAFAWASFVLMLWSLISFLAFIYGYSPSGFLSGCIFLTFAIKVIVISGWKENP